MKSGDSATIDLTDTDGKSWVFIDATHTQEITPTNPTTEWEGLTWQVNYAGPSDTAAKIAVEWSELITRFPTATVQAKNDSNNSYSVRFGNTGSTAAQCSSSTYTCLSNFALSGVDWSGVTVTGSGVNRAASITLTTSLTKSAFATALTGLDNNEGTFPGTAPTAGIIVETVLNAAS